MQGRVEILLVPSCYRNWDDFQLYYTAPLTAVFRQHISSFLGNPASGTRPRRHLEMPISSSGKIPAHNPKSATPEEGYWPQRMEGGGVSTGTRTSFVSVQMVRREGHGADVESTKEARMPTQVTQEAEKGDRRKKVTAEAKKSFSHLSEIEKAKERPVQES